MSTTSLHWLSATGPEARATSLRASISAYAIALLFCFFAAHGVFSFLGGSAEFALSASPGNSARRAVVALAWSLGLTLLLPYIRSIATYSLNDPAFCALPVLALLSAAWSQDPISTLHNSTYLLLTTLFAIYLAIAFRPEEHLQLVTLGGLLSTLACFVAAFALPAAGLDRTADAGALQGIYVGKNVCALVTLFFLTPTLARPWSWILRRPAQIAYALLLLAAIAATRSRTGVGLAILCLVSAPALRMVGRFHKRVHAGLALALLLPAWISLWLLFSRYAQILAMLGRDTTLHGRTLIWQALIISISHHPWLGYGYGAFWLGLRGEDMNVFPLIHWVMGYAHNGYLEICAQLGLVGLALVLWLLLRTCRDAWTCLRAGRPPYVDWYIGIALLTLVYNVDEAFLGAFHQLPWILFLVASAGLRHSARALRQLDSLVDARSPALAPGRLFTTVGEARP
jgi:exopolysaccharide production protein ExoQ